MKKTIKNKFKEENESLYSNEIKRMREIVGDRKNVNSFVLGMYDALVEGRYITDKMLEHIRKIIKINDPEVRIRRGEWVKEVSEKIKNVIEMVNKTGWTEFYKDGKRLFLESILNQAKERLTLTEKQLLIVNKIYKQAKKRIEKEGK